MNDVWQRLLAFLVSVGVHVALIFSVIPRETVVLMPEEIKVQVPVEFVVKVAPKEPESPPPPPVPDIIREVLKPSKPVSKPETPQVSEEPKSLPSDRETPMVGKQTLPVYPKAALNQGLSGQIVADFSINSEGKPTGYTVIQSTGHRTLDEAFIKTVLGFYTFEPKRIFGKNVPGVIRLAYTFSMEDE